MIEALFVVVPMLGLAGLQFIERRLWQKERKELLIVALSKSPTDALILGRALGAEPAPPAEPAENKPPRLPQLPLGL